MTSATNPAQTTTGQTATDRTADRRRTRPAPQWQWLLRLGCLVTAGGAVVLQAAGRFVGPSLAVLVVLMLIAALLVYRRPRTAAWLAGAATVADLVLHGGLHVAPLLVPEALYVPVINAVAVTTALLVLVAAWQVVATYRRPRAVPTRVPRLLATGCAVAVALYAVVAVVSYGTRSSVTPAAGEAVLVHDGVQVSDYEVRVDGGTLVIRNDDKVFPRSFDVDGLGVHVLVPPATSRRVTVDGEPGNYPFYDAITMTDATSGTLQVIG